ncbi:hypothetical protein CYMTET_32241 [Cymbomonas tetramitiformis]|uniref:Uncharacterized protein n=1 Tax=Cymbomonas tetramitiformis TaxID=36881 RepID=A0AAE0FG57_9CHLO|nr:hypothetical protein CYMTET_32241 [Cymbomonas tetramitiformis]
MGRSHKHLGDCVNIAASQPSVCICHRRLASALLWPLLYAGNNLCGINEYGIGSYDPRGIKALVEVLLQGVGPLHTLNLAGNALRQQEALALVTAISLRGKCSGDQAKLKVLDVGGNTTRLTYEAINGFEGCFVRCSASPYLRSK